MVGSFSGGTRCSRRCDDSDAEWALVTNDMDGRAQSDRGHRGFCRKPQSHQCVTHCSRAGTARTCAWSATRILGRRSRAAVARSAQLLALSDPLRRGGLVEDAQLQDQRPSGCARRLCDGHLRFHSGRRGALPRHRSTSAPAITQRCGALEGGREEHQIVAVITGDPAVDHSVT